MCKKTVSTLQNKFKFVESNLEEEAFSKNVYLEQLYLNYSNIARKILKIREFTIRFDNIPSVIGGVLFEIRELCKQYPKKKFKICKIIHFDEALIGKKLKSENNCIYTTVILLEIKKARIVSTIKKKFEIYPHYSDIAQKFENRNMRIIALWDPGSKK
ncbi:unnamed protein product [Caenorhabditis angaria]|uniref:Uncharacterized protein n=1 Tax=Caenorhabditis angaria TaxID=860376 RepID=A0A9P1IDV4_9PELO|nr:unnamed protein product [Caenorhabditis angaria]